MSQKNIIVIFITLFPIGLFAFAAIFLGQDVNWDQLNYHLGVSFLLQNDTFWTSVSPAGIQSYFNPYLQSFNFWIIQSLPPKLASLVFASLQSIGLMFAGVACLKIASRVADYEISATKSNNEVFWLTLGGLAFSLMAPVALSTVGTTFADLTTASFVIASYTVLLFRDRVGYFLAATIAGFLMGIAIGLKLTNAVFAIGVIGFLVSGPDSVRQRAIWFVIFGVASAALYISLNGYWAFGLWQQFKNPIFPYFNGIFEASGFSDQNWRDSRFLPESWIDFWRYPIYWAQGYSPRSGIGSISAEVSFRDVRWLFLTFGSILLVIHLLLISHQKRRLLFLRPEIGFFVAIVTSYSIWLGLFGIHRYLAAGDVLCGAAIIFLITLVPSKRSRVYLLSLSLLVTASLIQIPSWGRAPWNEKWQGIDRSQFEGLDSGLVFLTGKPMLVIAASMPKTMRYVGLYDFDFSSGSNNKLSEQLEEIVLEMMNGPIYTVDFGSLPASTENILKGFALVQTGDCKIFSEIQTYRVCTVFPTR